MKEAKKREEKQKELKEKEKKRKEAKEKERLPFKILFTMSLNSYYNIVNANSSLHAINILFINSSQNVRFFLTLLGFCSRK